MKGVRFTCLDRGCAIRAGIFPRTARHERCDATLRQFQGRLDSLQCAVVTEKLKLIPDELEARRRIAAIYDRHYRVYDKLYGDLKERFTQIAALTT